MDKMKDQILRIVAGDQYAIPFPIYVSGARATPDNVMGVRIQLNDTLKEWPSEDEGAITFDQDRQVWLWPLTEAMSREWPVQRLSAQVGINFGGGDFRYTPNFQLEILPNIIKEAWE